MKRYLKWWVVLLGVLVVLSIFIITLSKGDTSKNRKIAEDLLELHRCSRTNGDLTSFLLSLRNLPFPGGATVHCGASISSVYVVRCYELPVHLDEYYWLDTDTTNISMATTPWTLKRGLYWRGQHDHRLVAQKLLTLVETNKARPNP